MFHWESQSGPAASGREPRPGGSQPWPRHTAASPRSDRQTVALSRAAPPLVGRGRRGEEREEPRTTPPTSIRPAPHPSPHALPLPCPAQPSSPCSAPLRFAPKSPAFTNPGALYVSPSDRDVRGTRSYRQISVMDLSCFERGGLWNLPNLAYLQGGGAFVRERACPPPPRSTLSDSTTILRETQKLAIGRYDTRRQRARTWQEYPRNKLPKGFYTS